MKKRIWELDFLRGFLLWGMIGIHLIYDLVDLYGVWDWEQPAAYLLFKNRFGISFVILSGLCATLGRNSVRRGVKVFSCGMVCTLATYLMVWAGMADRGLLIYFGVLHCLGTCMLLWPLFKKLPTWALLILGLAMAVYGEFLRDTAYPWATWLFPPGVQGLRLRLLRLFPPAAQPWLFPAGRCAGTNPLPGKGQPAAPGQ